MSSMNRLVIDCVGRLIGECMGGDLGGTGGGTVPPKKIEVGGRPMHPFPPIFLEVLLSDACESTN